MAWVKKKNNSYWLQGALPRMSLPPGATSDLRLVLFTGLVNSIPIALRPHRIVMIVQAISQSHRCCLLKLLRENVAF